MVHISNGNIKLGNILNINLPPIISCQKDVPCGKEKLCYALKSYRMYPNVRKAWDDNLNEFLKSPDNYYDEINLFLSKKKKITRFRWHASGDIINDKYFDIMKQISINYPNIKFLAYTKNNTINYHNIPNNLIIRFSYWPNYQNKTNLNNFAWINLLSN